MGIQWNPTKWIDDLVEKRMHAAGQAMVAIAETMVAVDSGDLQKSIGYRYDRATKTLTLYAGTNHAIPQEFGTWKMRPHPFLRPAMNAAGPAFLTGKMAGVSTNISAGTSINPNHTPRKIKANIRPHISAANAMHNVGVTKRTSLTAVHTDRAGTPRRHNVGLEQKSKVMLSSLTKLNRIRKAWN
ncbi:MAG: hypothetical protein P4L67_04925 [Candidatus Pacebacteria bacterium]|nr:hypothetical protein [Candidatus Paceibacterota bacterium]